MDALEWIHHLKMKPHPEGGFYCNGYSGFPLIELSGPGRAYSGMRRLYSSIYYLLGKGDFSAFHMLTTDEMWHHYQGGLLKLIMIAPDGSLSVHLLGNAPQKGALFQLLVPHHHWFAVVPESGCEFALCGCTLSPGYDDADFKMADRVALSDDFPQHKLLIDEFTRS